MVGCVKWNELLGNFKYNNNNNNKNNTCRLMTKMLKIPCPK